MNRFTRKCVVDRKIVESLILKKSFNEISRTLKVGKRRIRTVNNLRYNQFRRALSMRPIQKYSDFFMDGQAKTERQKQILAKFYKVYGRDENGHDNVEMIDLLVGTLSEEVRPTNFGFGETMFHIFILMASRRLMADPFYTDHYKPEYYTHAGMNWVDDEGYLHKVIGRHMPELKPHMKGIETAFNPWKQ